MPSKQQEAKLKTTAWGKVIDILLLVLASGALFLAQSSLWISNVVFDQTTFTDITTRVLTTEQSRDAIAGSIIDRAFEGRPVAERLLADRATSFVSSMLASDMSERLLSRIATTSYAYLTSADRQDIAVDLTPIKEPLSGIISFAQNRGRDVTFDPQAIPDQVVLLRSDELPEIAPYIRGALAAAFVFWLSVVVLFAIYLFRQRDNLRRALYWVGAVVVAGSVVAMSTGPFIPPFIASLIDNIQFRGVASSLAEAYLQPFIRQMYLTIGLAALLLLVTRFYWVFVKSWQSAYKALSGRVGK